ncbi:hypothetical protein ACH0B6_00965 [Solibacillus silvestris]
MNTVYIDDNHYIKWRNTPWDEKAFQKKTLEILEIHYENEGMLFDIFNRINDIVESEKAEVIYVRYDSSNMAVKRSATKFGYQIVEHSYYVSHPNLKKLALKNTKLKIRDFAKEDEGILKSIVKESFLHGRFHEDPFLGADLAKNRYENWIPQLIEDTNFHIIEIKGEVAGFFNYVIKDDILDLPLSGLSKQYSGLGGYMWNDMFSYIQEKEDVKKVKIMISAANIAVLNLYTALGFKVTESLFGYHKHIQR